MKQIYPRAFYEDKPCSVVSIGCASESIYGSFDYGRIREFSNRASANGNYASLQSVNEQIRKFFSVKRYTYFTRVQRKPLYEWFKSKTCQKAIICTYGHYIFFDNDSYYSYFDNSRDMVVAVWELV